VDTVNKENLIQLTKGIYKLTILFPKKEPLRYKIRESAIDILAGSLPILENKSTNFKKLSLEVRESFEALNCYLEVAKIQNWVSQADILKFQQEYIIVMLEIEKLSEQRIRALLEAELQQKLLFMPVSSKNETLVGTENNHEQEDTIDLNERQKKIIETLKNKEKLQVQEIKQIFPDITKRTLRRDFENLVSRKLVRRIGSRNTTAYKLLVIGQN
jgi:hypothetical protein